MKKAVYLTLLAAVAFAALAAAMVPQLALTPDKDHSAEDIARAFTLRRVAPVATAALALVALLLAVLAWRQPRRPGALWGGLQAALLLVLLAAPVGAVLLSRSSMAERFFPALGAAPITDVAGADLADDDLVIGIEIAGQARAYPVAIVGFHHIVHDEVAGAPIVATY